MYLRIHVLHDIYISRKNYFLLLFISLKLYKLNEDSRQLLLLDAEPTWNTPPNVQCGVRPKRTNGRNGASWDEQL